MRYIMVLLCIAIAAANSMAGEKSNAQRWAETIAPFVNEHTYAVTHIDLPQIPWAKVRSYAQVVEQLGKREMAAVDKLTVIAKQLIKAGARDVFIVEDIDSAWAGSFGVIPIPKDANIAKFDEITKLFAKKIRGAYVISGGYYERLKTFEPKPRPELQQAFAAASKGSNRTIAIPPPFLRKALIELIPELPAELGGGLTRELADGYQWSATQVRFAPAISTRILIQSRDERSAKWLSARIPAILKLVGRNSAVKEMLPEISKLIPHATIKHHESQITVSLGEAFFNELSRQIKARIQRMERIAKNTRGLKHLGIAMHNYFSANGHLPLAANFDAKGKPLLSWRVHILPFIEQDQLHKQFRLNEPWNSPHNKKLISKMPKIFESPFAKLPDGKTIYVVPVGKRTLFDGQRKLSLGSISDGTSNTLMIVTVNDANAVIWTKPDDFDVSAKDPMKRLLRPKADGFYAAFADGSVRMISRKIMLQTLRALFTRAGGEVIDDKEF